MRLSFRLKIAVLTAFFSAAPLLAVGLLVVDANAREIESSSRALQLALAESIASRIDEDAERSERALAAVGSALTDVTLSPESRLSLALRLLEAEPALDVVAVYDHEGALIDRMRAPSAADIATASELDPALERRARDEGSALGPPSREAGEVRTLLVVPLRAGERVTGFAAAPLALGPVQREVSRLSRSHLASEEGVLMVVDATRTTLAHPDASMSLRRAELALPAEVDVLSLSLAPRAFEHTDAAGRVWLSTAVGLSRRPWAVVAQIPADVAYASLREVRGIVGAAIAAALLLAVLASFLLGARLTAPIATLVEFTRALAARRFGERVKIETGDELALLGDALSDAARQLEESEERTQKDAAIRADLGRYLSGELVEAIIRREQSMELGGQRVPITVLFADVVAFTPLSDRLPPEQVVALLNELFTLLTEAVFRHGGTVDKLIGDCVMALWGAPTPVPDHARRALLAAQDMLRFCETAREDWKARFGVDVQLAIGINSGEAVVGNVGSRDRMEYTAIGDVVNVAARLETIARPQQILVSRATADAVEGEFEITGLGSREVPGRKEAVDLCEVAW